MKSRWIARAFTGAALTAVCAITMLGAGQPGWAQGDTNLANKIARKPGRQISDRTWPLYRHCG
jgi:hypothetical protein